MLYVVGHSGSGLQRSTSWPLQGVKNIGRWTQQQDGGKSWRHLVSAGNALTSLAGIHKKINAIRDYPNNSYNFEAKLMSLSDDIQNCLTEIVDVLQ